MNPIVCECGKEVIPHETHLQRWEDIYQSMLSKYHTTLNDDQIIEISINFFNEVNDFIISENIGKQRMETTKQIQDYKKANIKAIKKED